MTDGEKWISLEEARQARAKRRNGSTSADVVEIVAGSNIQPRAVRWRWQNYLACGKLHVLAGMAGSGKTTIALSLAATVTVGGLWPDGTAAEQGCVLMWSGEDDPDDTLLPRFLAAGGERSRIHFITGMTSDGKRRPFDPSIDMPALAEAARKLRPAMLTLDPVVSAVRGDSHKNSETRRGLQPVVDLAADLDCAALGVSHLSKNTSGHEPLERLTGSIAFGAVARVVLLTVKPADPALARRLILAKSNLGPDGGGFEYTLFSAPVPDQAFNSQAIEWGSALEGSARSLMKVEEPDSDAGALEAATDFLLTALAAGPVLVKELREAARAHGHAWRTVERAKQGNGVTATKAGLTEGWCWGLPNDRTTAPTMSGKWDLPGVPHQGWTCIGLEDLGAPDAVCDMCEAQEIRYVHSMQHPDYDAVLECGCICAGNMEQNQQGARAREQRMKSLATRRLNWAAREWRTSENGNPFVNARGFNIVVFRSRKGWAVKVEQRYGSRCQFGKRRFKTAAEAKARAFDALIWAEQSWAGNGRYTIANDGRGTTP